MKTIYIDESGYTGFDLLNAEQPVQAASSLMIDEGTAGELIDEYFPSRQSPELKHQSLSRRKSNWHKLLEMHKVILDEHMGFTYVCDKRFMLILRFLDDCVEPSFYKNKVDFYEGGHHYALASLLYYTGETFWGRDKFNNLLLYYQRAARNKTVFDIGLLTDHAKSLLGKEMSEILAPLAMKEECIIKELSIDVNSTDIAFIIVIGLISHLEKHLKGSYSIIHDTSENLLVFDDIFKQYIEIKDGRDFNITSTTNISFPLNLKEIGQKDSKSSYGVQLADLLVGGVVEHFKAMKGLIEKNDYNQNVMELYGNTNFLHQFPNLDFESK